MSEEKHTPPPTAATRGNRFSAVFQHVPTVLVLGGAAIAFWGHKTGWTTPSFSEVAGQKTAVKEEDWCSEHNVPESICIACHPELVGASMTDWCKEHGVPESRCTVCHPEILLKGVAADWCKEHGVPESSCTLCHAEIGVFNQSIELDGKPATTGPGRSAASTGKMRVLPDLSFAFTAPPSPGKDPKTCQTHAHKVQFASLESIKRAGVKLAYVTEGPMTQTLPANAEIGYDRNLTTQISPRASGTAWQVFAELGQTVRKGDLLMLVESAEIGKIKAELLEAAAAIEARSKTAKRLEASADAGFRTAAELQDAQAAVKEARVRVYNARQALIAMGLPLSTEQAQNASEQELQFLGLPQATVNTLDREKTTANLLPVFATQDGIITARNVASGEIVDTARPLFTITDTRKMWMTLDLPADQSARAKVGSPVTFHSDASGGTMVSGVLDWISTSIDDQTRTIKMRAIVDNTDGRLRANTFGRAEVLIRQTDNAIYVPSDSVQWEGCCYVVFVRLSDTIFQTRKVRIGAKSNGMTEIMVGVLPGEVVASSGSHVLLSDILKSSLGAGCTDD